MVIIYSFLKSFQKSFNTLKILCFRLSSKKTLDTFPFDTHIECCDHFFSHLNISFHVKYAGSKFLIKTSWSVKNVSTETCIHAHVFVNLVLILKYSSDNRNCAFNKDMRIKRGFSCRYKMHTTNPKR